MRLDTIWRFLALATLACAARSGPMDASERVSATRREEPEHYVRSVRVGDAEVQLDSSATLVSVHTALGFEAPPSIERSGEYSQVCYLLSAQPRASLLLRSWDLGGPRMTVLGFRLEAGVGAPASGLCRQLNIPSSGVSTDRGLRLGLDSAEVTRLLGVPDSVRGQSRYYMRMASTPSGIDELSSVVIGEESGLVTVIEASFVRTR